MKSGSIGGHARVAVLMALLVSPLSPAALGCGAEVFVEGDGAVGGASAGSGLGGGGELSIPQSCADACGAFAHCFAAGAADCEQRCASSRTSACASLQDEALRCLLEGSEPAACKLADGCSVVQIGSAVPASS